VPNFTNDPVQSTTDTTSAAVIAENTNPTNAAGVGVHAKSAAAGVLGESSTWHGVAGITQSTTGGAGVFGAGETGGSGVVGTSKTWVGVFGETFGSTNGPAGVWADGHEGGSGVKGHTSCPGAFGVGGFHLTNQGPGIFGQGAPAGRFEGDVEVTGDIRLIGADCAEDFDIAGGQDVEPGTVMVLTDEGSLTPSSRPHDKRVAGVVSGAGGYRPGILLDRQAVGRARLPVALLGKAFCKVDASRSPIAVGDLLTSSETPGHAMKATDPLKAFGAVLGKALQPLSGGHGLIPILIALQ
jgi:hypothetical protein